MLESLLAPALAIRVQAANALGGFALGLSSCPEHAVCESVSSMVVEFFMRNDPLPGNVQTTMQRTLATTMRNMEPVHHAQGPFWAISVLSGLIVLAGPALFTNCEFLLALRKMIMLAQHAKKKLIRAFSSTLWGPLTWVWKKWRSSDIIVSDDGEGGGPESREAALTHFKDLLLVPTHLPIISAVMCGVLGKASQECSVDDLEFMMLSLKKTAEEGGDSTQRCLDVLDRLVNSRDLTDTFVDNWDDIIEDKLLPQGLFSTFPGLLSTDVKEISPVIEKLLVQHPSVDELRPFSKEESRLQCVWNSTRDIWIYCLEKLQLSDGESIPVSQRTFRHVLLLNVV